MTSESNREKLLSNREKEREREGERDQSEFTKKVKTQRKSSQLAASSFVSKYIVVHRMQFTMSIESQCTCAYDYAITEH